MPEPGQRHDERPPLGGAERAEVGPDEEDLGLARRFQRGLVGTARVGATSGRAGRSRRPSRRPTAGTLPTWAITELEVGDPVHHPR